MTTRPVRAKASRVKAFAVLGLKLGMARNGSQLILAMGELALVAVLASTYLGKTATQLGLVARRGHAAAAAARRTGNSRSIGQALLLGWLAKASVELFVVLFAGRNIIEMSARC